MYTRVKGNHMPDIVERIQKEWAVISGAPWSIAITTVLLCGAIWFLVNQINNGTISAKDATIESLKAQIEA